MKIISLGWGVQSFTIAAMVALGELEPVDYAIHADTSHERKATYEFASRWLFWLEEHGVKVRSVYDPNPTVITNRVGGEIFVPAFTNTPSSNGGQLRRQCTGRWKIAPMRRWFQTNRNGAPIELWIGISTDEAARMKPSGVKYIINRWPLIEKRMSRNDCRDWLMAHQLEIPHKSACTFCPYHDSKEWQDIMHNPSDSHEAIMTDRAIRYIRPPYNLYIHPSRKPLEIVDFRTAEERGQLRLWDEECSGMCGV